MPIMGECFDNGIGAESEAKRKGTNRLNQAACAILKLAGVTGLEADPFCDFPKEYHGKCGHVHTGAHKI
jgi:hypothetical protein